MVREMAPHRLTVAEKPSGRSQLEDAGSYVGEGCRNGWSIWVRHRGLARTKIATLGTWKGGRPLITTRGDLTCNVLDGVLLAGFLFVLNTLAGARGSLSIGGGGVVVLVVVAGGEGVHVRCASPVFSCLVAVGAQLSVPFGVAASLAKLGIVEWYEEFRVLSHGEDRCGRCSGSFFPLPGAGGASGDKRRGGHMSGGRD